MPGPTSYAKRNNDCSVISAFRLLINELMLRHIKLCTETKARQQLQNNSWSHPLEELEAFIALLYVRGVCGAKQLPIDFLWSPNWGV